MQKLELEKKKNKFYKNNKFHTIHFIQFNTCLLLFMIQWVLFTWHFREF